MIYLIAGVLATSCGLGIEYLGSLAFGPWGWTVAHLSAPWLLLPFAVGYLGRGARRAVVLGLTVTLAGLLGYVLPLVLDAGAAAHGLTAGIAVRETATQARLLVGGFVSGPAFGWLGYRWRRDRFWLSALMAAGSLCFEPLALSAVGLAWGPTDVYVLEIATGLLLAGAFFWVARRPPHGNSNPSAS